MATTTYEIDDHSWRSIIAGGSISEVIVSSVALALAILGIAGVAPAATGSLAAIGVGAALLFGGGAMGARFAKVLQRREGDLLTTGDVAGGITAELAAGAAGILLGVFALVGFAPESLLASAALAYSLGLLLGCGALSHANSVSDPRDAHVEGESVPPKRDAMLLAATLQLLVGLGGLVIGIAALLGAYTVPLALGAFALVAWAEVVGGVALGATKWRRELEQ
jgi:hypothetical protein